MSSVSIVIPTYYRNELLDRTLRSVQDSNTDETEVIIIDDSGERHAEETVTDFSPSGFDIHYVPKQTNEGLTLARKTGLEHVKTEFVHFLDDDDQLLPGAIEKKLQVAEQRDADVVYSGFYLDDKSRTVLPSETYRGNVLQGALMFDLSPCIPSTMLARTEKMEQVDFERIANEGLHNEHAMQIELSQFAKYEYVDEPLLIRDAAADSRGGSKMAVEEYQRTHDAYKHLYREAPPEVQARSRAYIHFLRGNLFVNSSVWSPQAILEFIKASYYQPGIHLIYIGALVSTLFGRLGYRVGQKGYEHLVVEREQKGRSF